MEKLYNKDCLEVMGDMNDSSINLTITSPPYDDLRDYGGGLSWGESVWKNIIFELYRVTTDGGVVVWVVGDATKDGSETGSSFRQALYAIECGFNLHDTMIYEKPQACFGSNKCYLQSFEYMFVFSKGSPSTINFIRDRNNVRGGVSESTTVRGVGKDGSRSLRHTREADKMGKRKNIWRYGVGGGNTNHPAVFPIKLAEDHIRSWSSEGDIVFDPFMGSGTTGVACRRLRRGFVGAEIFREYYDSAVRRIENETPSLL